MDVMVRGEEAVLKHYVRDLTVCTPDELRARWQGRDLEAIAKIDPVPFEKRIENHNPIFFLAKQVFFANVKGNPAYLYAPFHRDLICKELLEYDFQPEGGSEGLLLLAQRDSFKSTFGQGVLPMWKAFRAWHMENGKQIRLALIHQKLEQAQGNLVRIKNFLRGSPWLAKYWDEFTSGRDFGTLTEWNWPCYKATGAAESAMIARGLRADLTGLHFDAIFFDDLVTKEHIKSRLVRENTALLFESFMYNMDITSSKTYCTGTLYHSHDLWNRLVASELYKVVRISAGGGRAGLPLSFPTRHTDERLERMRQKAMRANNGDDTLWWMQMQNIVHSSTMRATVPEHLRSVRLADVPTDLWLCIIVDPAWKGTENYGEGDFASIQVWGFERRGNLVLRYLLDGVHSRELTDAQGRAEIFRLARKWGARDCAPEEIGGRAFRESLKRQAVAEGMTFHVIDLKTSNVNKTQRMANFCGDIESGCVFVVEGSCPESLERALREQHTLFGPQLDLDDALDCAAYTNDPAVAERCAPAWDDRKRRGNKWDQILKERQPAELDRTLYCGE